MSILMSSSQSPELDTRPAESFTIREFAPERDYPHIVVVENAVFPEYEGTPEECRFSDERRDPKVRWARFVAEKPGVGVVGTASYEQDIAMYHPRKFDVGVSVLPEHQGQGIGSALYDFVMKSLAPFDPILVRSHVREDMTRGLRFVQRCGYTEEQRDWESRLDVSAFDFAPWEQAEERVRAQGYTITSFSELAADPDRDYKTYELDWDITKDMPSQDTLTKPTFENFRKTCLENPNFLPDAWFIARDAGGSYVGISTLWKSQAMPDLFVGATGTRREHRRRGIALALKVRAVRYAKEVGCPTIRTWNEVNNRAMLSINEALGFVKQPAWISFARPLKEEPENEETK